MAKDTPSMAKNKMRRCFSAILDPHPSDKEVDEIWCYFSSSCAYCGVGLDRLSRKGHLDQVQPSGAGGGNGIHNHVLACNICNGDEKREQPWLEFLLSKAETTAVLDSRREKIESWLNEGAKKKTLSPERQAIANNAIENALLAFEQAVDVLRKLRADG